MVRNARYEIFLPIKWFFATVIVLIIGVYENRAAYVPPSAKVEPLYPVGLRISVPHEEGISLVAYHVKFNEDFYSLEAGTIAVDIIKPRNGRWVYEDRSTKLKQGDVIYYWVHVVYNGLGYNLLDQNHVVTDFFNYDGTPTTGLSTGTQVKDCKSISQTQIYAKSGELVSTCSGKLLFEDNFDVLNTSQWKIVESFSTVPDYEFVVYMNDEDNVQVKDGILHIKPTCLDGKYGDGFTRQGNLRLQKCTGSPESRECHRNALASHILPPVISGRLNTKGLFTFIYGRIEIRAKLPRGDWIYPLMTLECLDESTKNSSMYYTLRVGCASGNVVLTSPKGKDLSGHVLSAGAVGVTVSQGQHQQTNRWELPTKTSSSLWSDDYHTYELLWSRDRVVMKVDGEQYGEQPLSAVFNRAYYINLGVAVGGLGEFPDMSRSDSYVKPWRNIGAKALLNFYTAKNTWSPSWQNTDTGLHIDYVKVWAL